MMENVSAPTRALLAPFGDLLAPLQPHDGYCDLQKSSAREDFYSFYDEKAHPCDSSHEHNGHWTLKGRSGVAGLQHCLAPPMRVKSLANACSKAVAADCALADCIAISRLGVTSS